MTTHLRAPKVRLHGDILKRAGALTAVHGATSISWSSGVPAYSTISSATVATIVGGRGYVW